MELRAIALAMVMVLPALAVGQSTGLQVEILDTTFAYGPEGWKGATFDDGNPDGASRLVDWNRALGMRLDVDLRIRSANGEAGSDWRYRVTLTDGTTSLDGRLMIDTPGWLTATFDVDGQRALPDTATIPALAAGEWVVNVRAYVTDVQAGEVPRGSGSARFDAAGMEPLRMSYQGAWRMPWSAVPEETLPIVDEVGPGNAVWINQAPLFPGGTIGLEVDAHVGGRQIVWHMWRPDAPMDLGNPIPNPAGPSQGIVLGDVAWTHQNLTTAIVDPDGIALFNYHLPADATRGIRYIAAVDEAHGGIAVFAVGVSRGALNVAALETPEPGSEGNVALDLDWYGPVLEPVAQVETFALKHTGDRAAPVLTRGQGVPVGMTSFRVELDGRVLRAEAEGRYDLWSIARDADGAYLGHSVVGRGFELAIRPGTLGDGREGSVDVIVSQPTSNPDDGRALIGTMRFQFNADAEEAPFEIAAGGTLQRTYTVTPDAAGAATIQVVVDTGDLVHAVSFATIVLDEERFEAQEKPWYNPKKYVPGPELALVGLALLMAALRKR